MSDFSDDYAEANDLANRVANGSANLVQVGEVDPGPACGDLLTLNLNAYGEQERDFQLTWQGFVPGKRGDWMQTATGGQFFPLDPRPEEVHFADIAAALSKMCRFSGHCLRFYSVAEHCVLMAREAPDEFKLTTLMHDASEAYLADVIRPIKPFLTNYHDIESRLETVIAERFNYPWPMPAEVKRLDNAILADEMAQNMAPPPADWRLPEPPLGVRLQFWAPEKAEFEFRAAFTQYGGHFC